MNQDWLNRPELNSISPQKKAFIAEIIQASQKTSEKNILLLYTKVISQMKSQGLHFDEKESALLLEILESQMSREERTRFQSMKKIVAANKK